MSKLDEIIASLDNLIQRVTGDKYLSSGQREQINKELRTIRSKSAFVRTMDSGSVACDALREED